MSKEQYPRAQGGSQQPSFASYPSYQATSGGAGSPAGANVPYPYSQGTFPQQMPSQVSSPFQVSPAAPSFAAPSAPSVSANVPGMLPIEQSYVENILRLNKDKLVSAYMTFENQAEPQVFRGTIEAAGRDHLILKDPETSRRYLLLMVYLDYVVFDGRVNYEYPTPGTSPGLLSQYAPR